MLRRFKDAVKFNFTVSPDDVTLECLNKWEPHLLAVTCTRRSKKRSTKPIAWERSTENPAKLEVRWSIPENLEMTVTFYRDTDRTHFDDKEWNFVLEEIDGTKRKPLASEVINLASLASISQAEQKSLVLKLRPISSKIACAELAVTLSWVFVKAGNSKDDDMQSVVSFGAVSNQSFDDGDLTQLKRNHHGGSDASPFERATPGRSTTSFETGRRFKDFFKSHRNKEKSPKIKVTDGTRTLPLPAAHKPTQLPSVDGTPDNQSSEGTPTTTVSVSVHSDLAGNAADSPVRLGESPKDTSSSSTVIKRSALPSDYLKTVAERQKEASKKARPVYEGTPPSSPEVEEKPLPELAPPSEIALPPSLSVVDSAGSNFSAADSSLPLNITGATPRRGNIESEQQQQQETTATAASLSNDSTNEGASQVENQPPQQQPSEVNLQSLDLLDWCKQVTSGYPGVCVTNLTTSWRNGLAFAATIHHFRPDLIDWDELIKAQSQSQLVYKRVLDAVLALNVTSLPWEHGSAIDLNAVPDRLLVTKFLYELRQKLSNASQEPEIEHIEPEDYPPLVISFRDDSISNVMAVSSESGGNESRNKLSPSSSMTSSDRPRVVSPVLGSAPKPAPGTPLMTRQQFYNPLDSDDEDPSSKELLNLFVSKPPPVPNRTNQPQVSPVKTPNIQRAASSPKTKIRVIKPNQPSQSGSSGVLPEGGSSVSSSADSSVSLTLPKVVEIPEVMSASAAVRQRPTPPASPRISASSDSNLARGKKSSSDEQPPPRKNSTSSSGSASRLRDVISSRPILNFPDEIDHVPLPAEPPPPPVLASESQQQQTNNGAAATTTANPKVLHSGVSMLVDVEPGEQEALGRQQAAIEKETADIQNLLQRMALTGDHDMEPTLLQRLFVLVNRKDAIVRRKFQVDLVEKERDLMQQRDEIEQKLRQLLAKEDRTNREWCVLEADLMNRLRAVVLERESVVEQLDLQTTEIEYDEEMSSMNRIIVRPSVPVADNINNDSFNNNNDATISEYRSNNNRQQNITNNKNLLQKPVIAATSQSQSMASPRLGRFFAQQASAFRGWLSGGSTS